MLQQQQQQQRPDLSETMLQQQHQLLQHHTVHLAQDTLELPILALATEATPEPSHSSLDAKQPQLQLVESDSNIARLLSADAGEGGQTQTSLVSELGLGSQHCQAQCQPDEEGQVASEGALTKVSFCLVGRQHAVFYSHSPSLSCLRLKSKNSQFIVCTCTIFVYLWWALNAPPACLVNFMFSKTWLGCSIRLWLCRLEAHQLGCSS